MVVAGLGVVYRRAEERRDFEVLFVETKKKESTYRTGNACSDSTT